MLKQLCLIIVLITPAFAGSAQDGSRLEPLINALDLRDIFDVMRVEGENYGHDLDRELLDGAGGAGWQAAVSGIYEPERIWLTFLPRFTAVLEGRDVGAMTAFFSSKRGRQITSLEISARRAMLDKALEQSSREAYREMVAQGHPRLALLKELIIANDLVEYNVMGAMNASYAFYTGLIDGKAFDHVISQEDILKDVWSQEAEIRFDTQEWLYAYLALAYAPLTDADLQAYIDFSNSNAGRALNTALFAGYDDVFSNVSKALGLSAAQIMRAEPL
ncbi:DUF2059 domain-containing protein [Profundibacter sp.]